MANPAQPDPAASPFPMERNESEIDALQATGEAARDPERDPFLVALGERVRGLRARRGMTRRALSIASEVS